MILEAEVFAVLIGPLVACCIALSLFSKRLGYLKFVLYAFIVLWLPPLVLLIDIQIGAVVLYVQHYPQPLNSFGMSNFDLDGWAIADPLNDGPHVSIWVMIVTECFLFFVFSAGWRRFSHRSQICGLEIP
jgi:hypothetical protein